MPPVIIAAIAGIAAGIGAAGISVGLGIALGLATFAIGVASSLLQQNQASFEQRGARLLTSSRASVTPGRILIGVGRTGGPITFMVTTDDPDPAGVEQNRFLHLIITLAYTQIDEVLTVYFNDFPIHVHTMLDSNGLVTVGRFKDKARIQIDTGDISNVGDLAAYQPFPDLQSEVSSWTIDHKQLQRAKLYIRLKFDPTVFSNGLPNITAYVKGRQLLDLRDSVTDFTPNPAWAIRTLLIDDKSIGGMGVDGASASSTLEIDETSFIAAANDAEEFVSVNSEADPLFAVLRTSIILTGTNFSIVETISPGVYKYFPMLLEANANILVQKGVDLNTGDQVQFFPDIPNNRPDGLQATDTFFLILKSIGSQITVVPEEPDPVFQGLPNRPSTNDLTTEHTPQMYQVGFASSYLNAIRDIPIESNSPNTRTSPNDERTFANFKKIAEPRYTCSAIIELDRTPQEYFSDLLSCMSARLVYTGGKFKLVSYEYFTPTISYSETDFRKPLDVDPKISGRERFNIVKGLYTSILHLGRPSNYPVSSRAIYITEDNEKRLPRDFNFPFTPSQTMAQRLARVELEKHRQEITCSLPLDLSGMLVQAGDNIQLTFSDMGWTNKNFEILEWKFVLEEDLEGNPVAGVDLLVKETASAIWDWDETVDESALPDDLAQDTELPFGYFINPPGNLSVIESLFITTSGSFVHVRLTVSWTLSTGPYLSRYILEFKKSTDTTYQIMPSTTELTQEINDLETNLTYDIRVKAINFNGIPSAYTAIQHLVFGLSAPPGDAQNCVLHVVGDFVVLITVDPTVDDDVRLGGKIIVRHDKDTEGGNWINSVSLFSSTSSGELEAGSFVPGVKTQFFAPLKAGSYLVKFQDSAGSTSENACSMIVEQFSTDGFQTLATITEHSAFSGVHSNTTVNDGLLRLELYSDVSPSTDVISSGTYTFANSFSFGAKKKVRITSTIGVTIVDVNDLFDDRADNIDTWSNFDSLAQGENADAQMFIRYQTEDPAASPTPGFSAWQSIQTQGVFDIFAAEFKVDLSSFNSTVNIHIDTLSMIAEEPLAL